MPIGYRPLSCSDPEEQRLRDRWHALKRAAETSPCADARQAFAVVDAQLSGYIWKRAQATIDADRKRHPKAKRNQPVPASVPGVPGRCLP